VCWGNSSRVRHLAVTLMPILPDEPNEFEIGNSFFCPGERMAT
jgi:hypothetical protein